MQCNHKMALQPSLRSLIIMGSPNAMHTLDVFCAFFCHSGVQLIAEFFLRIVDYVCPYRYKSFGMLVSVT